MKKILLLIGLCGMIAACTSTPKDPVYQMVQDYVAKQAGEPVKVKINKLAKVDSTTYGTEIERRMHVYEVRIKENTKFYEKYSSENKPKNASLKYQAIQQDRERILWLRDTRDRMAASDSLDVVAYYDYCFSGKGTGETTVMDYDNVWFSMTIDGEILSMSNDQKDIHKRGGSVIPGYADMLLNSGEEDPELEN